MTALSCVCVALQNMCCHITMLYLMEQICLIPNLQQFHYSSVCEQSLSFYFCLVLLLKGISFPGIMLNKFIAQMLFFYVKPPQNITRVFFNQASLIESCFHG